MILDDDSIIKMIDGLNSRANKLEENLLNLSIHSEGHVSITEVYQMSFKQREMFIKLHNKYIDEKNKSNNSAI